MKHPIVAVVAFVLVMVLSYSGSVAAGTCNVTEYPATGTLTAERMNQRIRQTETCINGNIGNGNWNSSEKLAVSNLANPNAIYSASWTIDDEDSDATAGEDVSAATNARNWQVPVSSTVIGMTVALRCTAGSCAAANPTIVLQEDSNTIKSFNGLTWTSAVPQTDFTLATSITNADVLNLDISGTLTGVDFIDVTVYYKAQHQN